MTLHDMQDVLRQLTSLAEGWHAGQGIALIERDLALDKLRTLYEALLGADTAVPAAPEMEQAEPAVVDMNLDEVLSVGFAEPESMPEEVGFEAAPEEAPVASLVPEPAVEEGEFPIAEPAAEIAMQENPGPESTAIEPQPQPAAAEPKPVIPSLFPDESDGQRRHRQKQRMLMSLYDMEEPRPAVEPAAPRSGEPQPAPAPVEPAPIPVVPMPEEMLSDAAESASVEVSVVVEEEDELIIEEIEIVETPDEDDEPEVREDPEAVLGEVLNHNITTLADKLSAPHAAASEIARMERVVDLRKVIGINDRFLMIRDLFGGDAAAYDRAVEAINAFDDLDDCLIHIAENYAWNPNSDGAKLLMQLIERKLL